MFMSFHVYIIQSQKDGSYYVGSTQDLKERIGRHNQGRSTYTRSKCPWDPQDLKERIGRHNQGRSTYTRSKCPWELVYYEEHADRSSAIKREREIKRHKRKSYIVDLIREFGSG